MATPRPSPRTNRTRRVPYSQEKEGDKEIRCPVHMDILWARCYGLRAHIERARELHAIEGIDPGWQRESSDGSESDADVPTRAATAWCDVTHPS